MRYAVLFQHIVNDRNLLIVLCANRIRFSEALDAGLDLHAFKAQHTARKLRKRRCSCPSNPRKKVNDVVLTGLHIRIEFYRTGGVLDRKPQTLQHRHVCFNEAVDGFLAFFNSFFIGGNRRPHRSTGHSLQTTGKINAFYRLVAYLKQTRCVNFKLRNHGLIVD